MNLSVLFEANHCLPSSSPPGCRRRATSCREPRRGGEPISEGRYRKPGNVYVGFCTARSDLRQGPSAAEAASRLSAHFAGTISKVYWAIVVERRGKTKRVTCSTPRQGFRREGAWSASGCWNAGRIGPSWSCGLRREEVTNSGFSWHGGASRSWEMGNTARRLGLMPWMEEAGSPCTPEN